MIEGLAIGGAIVGGCWFLWNRFTGCTGGHHFTESEKRKLTIKYHGRVCEETVLTCDHDGCQAEKRDPTALGDVNYENAREYLWKEINGETDE